MIPRSAVRTMSDGQRTGIEDAFGLWQERPDREGSRRAKQQRGDAARRKAEEEKYRQALGAQGKYLERQQARTALLKVGLCARCGRENQGRRCREAAEAACTTPEIARFYHAWRASNQSIRCTKAARTIARARANDYVDYVNGKRGPNIAEFGTGGMGVWGGTWRVSAMGVEIQTTKALITSDCAI